MSTKLQKAYHLRAKDTPLTYEQVVDAAPAVFHDKKGVTTLGGYQHLSTAQVLTQLMGMGWAISEVAQTAARRDWERLEAKHLVRMRQTKDFGKAKGDVIPEIVVVNAHNASSKLHFYAGLWRLVCSNGLMAGTTIGQFSFYHNPKVVSQIEEAVQKLGQVMLPTMHQQVLAMQAKIMGQRQLQDFASAAYALRWATPVPSVLPEDLLRYRREADAANDVWHVFNRVQENLLQGGFPSRNSSRTVQPLTVVTNVVNINRDLWDLAARVAA